VKKIKSVCVYCGSSIGADGRFRAAAAKFGQLLAKAGIDLVYGGGRVGLMGVIADAATNAGGRVVGVIPEHLNSVEIGHQGIDELRVVDSMHERKNLMFELADAFVVLPGGIGTMDETFEIITWRQLHLHDKPIVVADIGGYWQPFLRMIDHMIAARYAKPSIRDLFLTVSTIEEILPALMAAPEPRQAEHVERF
jgi:uncharacterized protein (TIGR00730 family)